MSPSFVAIRRRWDPVERAATASGGHVVGVRRRFYKDSRRHPAAPFPARTCRCRATLDAVVTAVIVVVCCTVFVKLAEKRSSTAP